MAEHSTPEERTEMPTDRRMGKLRADGQVHMSNEVVQVISLLTGFYVLQHIWNGMFDGMKMIMIHCFRLIGEGQSLNVQTAMQEFKRVSYHMGVYIFTLTAAVGLCASLAVMLQTKWNVKSKKIEFKFDKILNPLAGIKRIFSIHGFINVLKAIFKLSIIGPIAYFGLAAFAPQMISLVHTSIDFILEYTGKAMNSLFWRIMYILIIAAIFDYFWGKHQWLKNVKMTKEEVKDEKKSIEGDEATRRAIMQKGLRRAYDRIKNSVPKADVIVTNPTHYSIALKYDRNTMRAPIVVAKGKGYKALKIREIAMEAGIPILERKPLARALYAYVKVGAEIPYDLFKAVAEVFAYIYKLKNPYAYLNQNQ